MDQKISLWRLASHSGQQRYLFWMYILFNRCVCRVCRCMAFCSCAICNWLWWFCVSIERLQTYGHYKLVQIFISKLTLRHRQCVVRCTIVLVWANRLPTYQRTKEHGKHQAPVIFWCGSGRRRLKRDARVHRQNASVIGICHFRLQLNELAWPTQ